MRALALLLLLIVMAGCFGASSRPPALQPPMWPVLPELEIDHDHTDTRLHADSVGLEMVGFVRARDVLEQEPARFSDVQFHENISIVTLNGREGATSGGFLILDITTPTHPEVVGRYRSGSEDNWYTKISPDGRYVFLTANGGAAIQPAVAGLEQSVRDAAAGTAARGIHVVDISDPRSPRLTGYHPAPVRVVNLAVWQARDQATYVAASMANDRVSRVTNTAVATQANYVSILRHDPGRQVLEEVARWQPTDTGDISDAFPHDLTVELHPIHGRELLYAAYWDAGAYVVDVSTPNRPQQVSRVPSLGPGDHVHTFKPHPFLMGDHYYAVLAPETFGGEPSGLYRLLDITNARAPRVLAQWQVPPGIEANPENLLFSPHEFSLAHGRLYASQFHGGAWVLDLPSFKPVATWQQSLATPQEGPGWALNIVSAAKYYEYLWLVDMSAGLIIMRETA